MANICDMNLYIVAETGDDMKSLLETMAASFEKVTGVNLLDNIGGFADWRTCARAMESGSENYNKLCFLSEDPDTRSEYGSFSATTANGRPCVCVSMGLKWGPSYQVKSFCDSLDRSKYGYACINGGEYMCAMGDEIAFIQWGDSFGDPYDGGCDYDEFISEKHDVLSKMPTTLHEMALRVLFSREDVGTFFWEHSGDYDEDGYDDDGYYSWSIPPVNWSVPTSDDLARIKSAVAEVLAALPITTNIYSGFTQEGNDAAESLMPGDAVVVNGKWNKDDFNGLTGSTVTGEQLGRFGEWLSIVDDYEVNRIAPGVLALLVPHVRATVAELTPLSLRNKGVDGPKLSVRLDALRIDDFNALLDEVEELLKKDCPERNLSSNVEEAM